MSIAIEEPIEYWLNRVKITLKNFSEPSLFEKRLSPNKFYLLIDYTTVTFGGARTLENASRDPTRFARKGPMIPYPTHILFFIYKQ